MSIEQLMEALRTAHGHIDMAALEISHCKDAELIRAALSQQSSDRGATIHADHNESLRLLREFDEAMGDSDDWPDTLDERERLKRLVDEVRFFLEPRKTDTKPSVVTPEPWGYVVNATLFRGEFAKHDAEAEAKHCGGMARVIPLYTHPVPSVPATPEPVADVRCEGCGYMTHHREHMGCVRAAKQHTHPTPSVFLVRDIASLLNASVPDVCNALAELGYEPRRSTNAAISPDEALAVASRISPAPSVPDDVALTIHELRHLADKFSEGWHEGIKIDAMDVMLLSDAARKLEIMQAAMLAAASINEPKGEDT